MAISSYSWRFPHLGISDMMETLSRYMTMHELFGDPYVIESMGSRTVRTRAVSDSVLLHEANDDCFDSMKENIGIIMNFAMRLIDHVTTMHRNDIVHGRIRPETILIRSTTLRFEGLDLGFVDGLRGTDIRDIAFCIAWLVARTHLGKFVAHKFRYAWDNFPESVKPHAVAKECMVNRFMVTSTHLNILQVIRHLEGQTVVPESRIYLPASLHENTQLLKTIMAKFSSPAVFDSKFVTLLVNIFIPAVHLQSKLADPIAEEEIADFVIILARPLLESYGAKCFASRTLRQFRRFSPELLKVVARQSRILEKVAETDPMCVLSVICDTCMFSQFSTICKGGLKLVNE